jgi:deazaflavin-dependent oxidoreductase (nitroreductase family)
MLSADKVTQFVYWATAGRVGERQGRYSMLLLHTIGRKSGKRRTHTLLYFQDGDDLVICASRNGSPQPPAWYLNLQASPRVQVQYGRIRREVLAVTVDSEDRERLWTRFVDIFPRYADEQNMTSRLFPIVRLKPLSARESEVS